MRRATTRLPSRIGHYGRRVRSGFFAAARRYRWLNVTVEMARCDREIAGTLLAAALAFRVFIWLLPCCLLLVGVLGFTASGPHSAENLTRQLELSPLTGSLLSQVGDQAERSRYPAVAAGAALLCLAGFTLSRALDGVRAGAWHQPVRRGLRPALVRAARDTAVLLAIVVGNVGGPIVQSVTGIPDAVISVASLAFFLLLGIVLLSTEWPPRYQQAFAGAALFAVGLEALRLVAVYYLPGKLARASQLYGALGVAATLLVWLALIARLVVLAHVLNAVLSERAGSPE